MVVISDFMDKHGYEEALRYLLARNLDIYVVQVLSREEVEPELVGDLRLVDALQCVAHAFESVAASLEADRRDRRAQADAFELVLRELLIRFVQPSAVPPAFLGGTVDSAALFTDRRGEVDINLSESPIPVGAHIEVRSRFDDHWVHGFAIAEYVSVSGRCGYRLRRLSDTEPLPMLFDAADVRRTTVATDHPTLDTAEEPQNSVWQ